MPLIHGRFWSLKVAVAAGVLMLAGNYGGVWAYVCSDTKNAPCATRGWCEPVCEPCAGKERIPEDVDDACVAVATGGNRDCKEQDNVPASVHCTTEYDCIKGTASCDGDSNKNACSGDVTTANEVHRRPQLAFNPCPS